MRLYGTSFPLHMKKKEKKTCKYIETKMVVTKNECNLRFKKEGKTNKNGNNCSTKDLVVKAADIFKAKTIKQNTNFVFYKRIRGGNN